MLERETIAKEREMFASAERLSAELSAKTAEKARECEEVETRLANVQKELEESGERERAKERELTAATTTLSALEESESRIRLELTEIREREQMFKQVIQLRYNSDTTYVTNKLVLTFIPFFRFKVRADSPRHTSLWHKSF